MSDGTSPTSSTLWPRLDVASADEASLWLKWVVRLRWVAIFSQIVTLAVSVRVLEHPTLVAPLSLVIGLLVVVNLRAERAMSQLRPTSRATLVAHLALDVVALTTFFLLAGGPTNPFVTLYFIHVAMAAVMLDARGAAAITALTLACFLVVHQFHLPLHLERHAFGEAAITAFGRVVSFTIAIVTVAFFVVGVAHTLRQREAQLREARERTAATDRLRAVGTLAAGAAHEINTPLSTMGLRVRRLRRRHDDDDTRRDLDVVENQLARVQQVVEQLLVGAGDPSVSAFERRELGELVGATLKMWGAGAGVIADLVDDSDSVVVEVPRIAFVQALINLLENARQAQEEAGVDTPLWIGVSRAGDDAVVVVRDHGIGLPDAGVRVGEPFFTTKPSGTGLGVFVARSLAEGAGGGLAYADTGSGTEARWWFPAAPRRTRR